MVTLAPAKLIVRRVGTPDMGEKLIVRRVRITSVTAEKLIVRHVGLPHQSPTLDHVVVTSDMAGKLIVRHVGLPQQLLMS